MTAVIGTLILQLRRYDSVGTPGLPDDHSAVLTWNRMINRYLFRERLFQYLLTVNIENTFTWTNVLGDDVDFNYSDIPHEQVIAAIRQETLLRGALRGRNIQGPHMRHFGQLKIRVGVRNIVIEHANQRDYPFSQAVMDAVSSGVFEFMTTFLKRVETIHEITELLHIDKSMETMYPIQSDASSSELDEEVIQASKRPRIESPERFKRLLVTSVYTDQSSRIAQILRVNPGIIPFPPTLRDMRIALLTGLRDRRVPL